MAQRTGISDAPPVTLGAGGREQLVPVLESFPDSSKIPGRTSIASMKEFFEGGGPAVTQQIQRFYMRASPTVTLIVPRFTPVDGSSPARALSLEKRSESLIVGDENFYNATNGGVGITRAGTYRLTGQLYTDPITASNEFNTDDPSTFQPVWLPVVLITGISPAIAVYGKPAISGYFPASQGVLFATFEEFITVTAQSIIALSGQVYNIGEASNTSRAGEWAFRYQTGLGISKVTIELIAEG